MNNENLLNAALEYAEKGYSVIPVQPENKKPYIKWAAYQKKPADAKQILRWFGNQFPDAMLGIITGDASGLTVIDTDSQQATESLLELLNGSNPPTASTPRGGRHFYFAYTKDLHTCSGTLPETDIRNDGGYIIAPPSQNGRGAYTWEKGRSILKGAKPAPLPLPIINVFNNAFNKGGFRGESIRANSTEHNKPLHSVTKRSIVFEEGGRDEALFCLANHLVKSGLDDANIRKYLYFFGENCNPPFPANEIEVKIQSAFQRAKNKERNLTQEVRDYLSVTWGNISVTNLAQALQIVTSDERAKLRVILKRMVDNEKVLERDPNRDGWFRCIDREYEELDFINAETETSDLWLPLGLNDLVETMPGDLIVVAGEPNAGKTALMLNIIKSNQHKFNTYLFSSEMSGAHLKKRLLKFDDMELTDWSFKAIPRSSNFADVIKPGKGNLNIIDFLEIHDDFFKVGGLLADIFRKLDGALAIVALQKNRGTDMGRGGIGTLEKPMLSLAVFPGKIKIVKGKNWADDERNPNGLQRNFKLAAGCRLFEDGDWYRDNPSETKK